MFSPKPGDILYSQCYDFLLPPTPYTHAHTTRIYSVSDEEVDDSKPKVITLPGTKEKKASSELHIRESQGESMMSRDTAEGEIVDESRRSDRLRSERDGQRSRLTMKKRSHNVKVSFLFFNIMGLCVIYIVNPPY